MIDFYDSIKSHAKQVLERKDHVLNEEGTKMALIVPFLQLLGYDPNDPRVVIPEYCADFGGKKECKVDYAIKRNGSITMIIEAKKVGDSLNGEREGQLQQYFQSLLEVKLAILTDGVVYKFFTDLEHKNIMDGKPFMVFDFSSIDESLISELKKICNDCFDLNNALSAAQELKYIGQIKKLVAQEIDSPSDDLVKFFARNVYDGILTARVVDEFRRRVKLAFENHLNDVLNARLQGAMYQSQKAYQTPFPEEPAEEEQPETNRESRIVTTAEEIEGFYIVRAIVSKFVDIEKVVMRDTISYCDILFEDNNRKPICRLHFNNINRLQLETFDTERKGTKHKLEKVSDIYKHAEALMAVVGFYNT